MYTLGLAQPFSDKGFLCRKAAKEMKEIVHISMGDILRAERDTPSSPWAKEIEDDIRKGKLVSSELTAVLLQSHVFKALLAGHRKFIIDGFPRTVKQAILFEKKVCTQIKTRSFGSLPHS